MALDKLVQDMLYRFKRLIIPELISPLDSFWGGEKNLRNEQGQIGIIASPKPIEMARVNLNIPSFFTIEILMDSTEDIIIRLTIGLGRGIVVREIDTRDSTTYDDDPLIDVASINFFNGSNGGTQRRIRIVVWGTSLKITILPAYINALSPSNNLIRVSVVPGAGALTSAIAAGQTNPTANASYADFKQVNQNAAAVVLLTNNELTGAGGLGDAPATHGLTIYNDAGADLYIIFSTINVTLTAFMTRIPPFTLWEEPFPFFVPSNLNIFLSGIWGAAGAGRANIMRYSRFI